MKRAILFITVYLSLTISYGQENNKASTAQQESEENTTTRSKTVAILPATLYFTASQGETQTQLIYIENGLDSPVQFRLSVVDFERDQNANLSYFEPGTGTNSCGKWISLDNNLVIVPGHQKRSIGVTLKVPDSADAVKEMKWAMVFLHGMQEKAMEEQSGDINASVEAAYKVGVQVYQTPPNVMNKELRMLAFTPQPQRGHYRVECKNVGSTLLRVKSYMELINTATGEKFTVYPEIDGKNAFKILPGQPRNIEYILNTVPKGKYTAIAIVDAGDVEVPLEAAELDIELK